MAERKLRSAIFAILYLHRKLLHYAKFSGGCLIYGKYYQG